jgi:hypothetical protein
LLIEDVTPKERLSVLSGKWAKIDLERGQTRARVGKFSYSLPVDIKIPSPLPRNKAANWWNGILAEPHDNILNSRDSFALGVDDRLAKHPRQIEFGG